MGAKESNKDEILYKLAPTLFLKNDPPPPSTLQKNL